jgi:hypothetical protein
MVKEAELGESTADHADVLRLEGFLTRNGHPHQRLDPKTDSCAQTLIERFHIDARDLPIVLCPLSTSDDPGLFTSAAVNRRDFSDLS